MRAENECLPCQGYCKQGAHCIHRNMAQKILAAVVEERSHMWSDDQVVWALTVTGDIPVAD